MRCSSCRGRSGKVKLRIPAARPRNDQIYFIGATNVPIDRLDPALIRPGRMGRHVWFRTPSKQDRLDILDLYIGKVSHDDELDSPTRRDEIARIMSGYSPAMIEQAISMALTIAHHTGEPGLRLGRPRRGGDDARCRHGERLRVHPDGAARRRDPRGGPRRGRPRVPDGPRVDAAHDQEARRPGRRWPPLDDREGGAPVLLPARDVPRHRLGPRRDGGRARRLRRELERRRRRRRRRHGPGSADGGSRRDGPAAVPRHAAQRRERGAGAQGRARPLREDRPADHVPRRRRRAVRRRSDLGRARRSGEADGRGPDPRPGLRDGPQPRAREPGRDRGDRRRAREQARDHGRRAACACSSRRRSRSPSSTSPTRPSGRRSSSRRPSDAARSPLGPGTPVETQA